MRKLIDERYPVYEQADVTVMSRDVAHTTIVNDVISAGSAVRGTLSDLIECEAETVAVASLAVLGQSFVEFAAAKYAGGDGQ